MGKTKLAWLVCGLWLVGLFCVVVFVGFGLFVYLF